VKYGVEAVCLSLCIVGSSLLLPGPAAAQGRESLEVACSSIAGQRAECPANASAGAALVKSAVPAACQLGKTWGFDDKKIWVSEGCGGTFALGPAALTRASSDATPPQTVPGAQSGQPTAPESKKPTERIESWGEFDPGDGFLVGRNNVGELAISAYALLRYVNQMPGSQTFTDHLGFEHSVNGRNDLFPHRVMVFFKGWVGDPKLVYQIFFWTVNTTDQKNLFASMGYQFSRKFSLYAGINGLPGTRSLQGSHPYWLGNDRVMADEYFRPYFANGVWAQGEITPGFWYNVMTGNNMSALGIKATQLDRKWSSGASVWWMPTTKEFGPKGAYGDWEYHEKLATRIGVSSTFSPEERFTDNNTGATGNTLVKLADSLNVFETSALVPGVTVQNVDYTLVSFDAGLKYKGIFLQTEIYNRWLKNFKADGPLPVASIHDSGYYLQGSFYPVKKRLEIYGATSWVFGDTSAGFTSSHEYIGGGNYYPFNSRDLRLNVQYQHIDRSPVSSTFGYYVGGQKGNTFATAFSVYF